MATLALWGGVAVLSAIGATARFWVFQLTDKYLSGKYSTVLVNTSGTLLLGLLVGFSADSDTRLLLGSGLLGSYTTFSTWMLDLEQLRSQRPVQAFLGVVGGLVLGVAALLVGRWIAS